MKRWWLWSAVGTVLLLVAGQQTWATGTWHDPVLGTSLVEATGTEVASSLTAGALLAGAALLAGLVGARPVRLAAAVCLAGAALLAGFPALRVLIDPQSLLDNIASRRPGAATLTVRVADASATVWPWVAAVGAVLVLVGAVLCAVAWFRPKGPTVTGLTVTEPAAAGTTAPGTSAPGPTRPRDPWDDLTRGDDPTLDDH